MSSKPLVSVIIPTYNRAGLVLKAIESVWIQTYPNVQLIVVDDGSEDNTQELIGMLGGLEYIRIPHGGHSVARNTGLDHAKGTLIATLDSDDTWHPDFLEKCVGAIEQYSLDFVFANWYQGHRNGKPQDFLSKDPFINPYLDKRNESPWVVLSEKELRSLYLVANPSPSSAVVMKKSAIICGWNKKLRIGEDWSLFLDMIFKKSGCRAAFTMEKLWSKHVHEQNIFDGRSREDVLETIVEDDLELMNVYRGFLTTDEMNVLRKKYVRDTMELAKLAITKKKNLKMSWNFAWKSFREMPFQACKEIFNLFHFAVYYRWEGLKRSFVSHMPNRGEAA